MCAVIMANKTNNKRIPGVCFTKGNQLAFLNLVKSRSREISLLNCQMDLDFDWRLRSSIATENIPYQSTKLA